MKNVDGFALIQAIAMAQEDKFEEEKMKMGVEKEKMEKEREVRIVDEPESETGIALEVEPTPEEVEEGFVEVVLTLPLLKKMLNKMGGIKGQAKVEEKLGLLFEEAEEPDEDKDRARKRVLIEKDLSDQEKELGIVWRG